MDFKEVYQDTCSTISVAARNGNVEALKSLIAKDKPYDVADNRGWTCIHEAASNGHVECLELLLELEDVDIHKRTFEYETALMLASSNGHSDCVQSLLTHGADPNAHTHDRDTALFRACMENHVDCVTALVKGGADINQRYFTDDTPLHTAISSHGNLEIVSYLVKQSADLRSRNEHGLTPLFLAAHFGHTDCLEFLIKRVLTKGKKAVKRYIEMAANDHATPLYIATQYGHWKCVKILLKYGADPLKGPKDNEDEKIIYPIQAAIEVNSFRCYELLADSLDDVLKQYTFEDGTQTVMYHPFILAQKHNDLQIFMAMLSEIKSAVGNGFPNIFTYSLSLPAASVYLILFRTWTFQNFKECISLRYLRYVDPKIFIMMLKYDFEESLTGQILFEQEVLTYIAGLPKNLGLFALLKYLHRRCSAEFCSSFISHVTNSRLSELQYRMLLYLLSFVSNIKDIRGYADLESTYKDNEIPDTAKQLKAIRKTISEMLGELICSVANSLQHNCRVNIVFQLVQNNNYNVENINSLPLPDMLKDYIKYKEFREDGEELLEGFEELARTERFVDGVIQATADKVS